MSVLGGAEGPKPGKLRAPGPGYTGVFWAFRV